MTQTPLQPLSEADVGRVIFAQVKLPKAKLQFTLGKIVKFYPGPARIEERKHLGRFARLYNCDVLFNGQRAGCGMFLENDGERCAYEGAPAATAAEGTWLYLAASSAS